MKIVVTGGAGFIGSHLCEALLEENHFVTCLDNFSTGKMKNIHSLLNHERFDLQYGDIRRPEDCRKACHGAEYVLHEAALGSVKRSVDDPATTNDVNVSGFLNMLVAARDAHVKRFIYASSSSVYGDAADLPKTENRTGKPLSPYAVTKCANELYAAACTRTGGMDCIGLRYFNVFGPRQTPDGPYAAVIPQFARKLIRLESPIINGDGEYTRDFTYVKNVVRMNLLALSTQNAKALNTVFNTACGQQTSLNQLAASLRTYLSAYDANIATVQAFHGPARAGDIPHSVACIEKAVELLHYHPVCDVQQGLAEAAQWYWENLNLNADFAGA
ncbi:MAG: NAD-dependent epimerase/dehydratase family protein [Tannerella sp.]|jgi:UDP-N-acetylglucosamine 4-epimerase|nr:NAD-dependent epimerase/dehydratase family protein [Tannerella sp.]